MRPAASLPCILGAVVLAVTAIAPSAADETVRILTSEATSSQSTLSIGRIRDGEPVVQPALDLSVLTSFVQPVQSPPVEPEVIDAGLVDPASRPFRPITQLTIDAGLPPGELPGRNGAGATQLTPTQQFGDSRLWGGWADTECNWSATALCHRPLYFEQVNVERYGYTPCPVLQPVVSGAHFFLTIPTLPYKIVAQPPRECVYTLGYYRAGSPAPRRWHHTNWDPTAATVEGLVVTGLVFLIP